MLTDITRRKKHERQLAVQARLLDLSTDAIIVRDMEDRVIYWSKGAEQLYGYANNEVLGKLKFELLKTAFSEPLEIIRATLYRDDRWSGELTHTCKNGVRIVVSARWILDRDSHGNPDLILETTNDITPRKPSERAVRAKAEQLQRLADLTPVCLTECGCDLKYKFVNHAYAEMLGLRPEEIVGRPIVEVIGAEAFAAIEPDIRSVLRGERVESECEVFYRSVGRRFVQVIYVPQTGERGDVEGWVASVSDITERKVLENRVAEGARQNAIMYDFVGKLNRATYIEQMYEAALDTMVSILQCQRASILLFDQTGVMRFVAWRGLSDAYRTAVEGHSPWNPGQSDPDVIPIDDVTFASLDTSLASVLKEEGIQALCFVPLTYEAKLIGKFMTYYDEAHTFTTDEVQLALAISRQLALAVQRKRAEDSRHESEALFRTLAESAPVMIWISGPDSSYSYFNRPWLRFTGRTLEQEIDNWALGVHPDDLQVCMDTYNVSVGSHLPFEREYRLRRHDGEYRWVLDHGIPRVTPGNIFIGYIGSCIDITDRKRAEDALKDADRRKDEFLAALAHELRNPLAPLRNGLEIMKLSADHYDSVASARSMMERQLEQLLKLIDDLMDVSRISQGKIVLHKERVELTEVIGSAREVCEDLIRQAGHELIVMLPDEPVFVDGDKVRLTQILSNLLCNAAKYTERGGRIWLRVERHETRIRVSVRDSGIGISESMLPKIFDLFTQVDGSLEKTHGGLGIGLTIAERLVAMHAGTLTASSEGIGKGSEFVFSLPAALSTRGTMQQLSEDESTTVGRKRILIADDNDDVASSLAVMLKIMGHEVRTANDGREAVEISREFHPDLILLDIGMPGLNGYDACIQIREQRWSQTHKTIIAALTGWGQEEARQRSEAAGFDHYFVKPIDPTALKGLLKRMQSPKALRQAG